MSFLKTKGIHQMAKAHTHAMNSPNKNVDKGEADI